jgi:hypothetical protein
MRKIVDWRPLAVDDTRTGSVLTVQRPPKQWRDLLGLLSHFDGRLSWCLLCRLPKMLRSDPTKSARFNKMKSPTLFYIAFFSYAVYYLVVIVSSIYLCNQSS